MPLASLYSMFHEWIENIYLKDLPAHTSSTQGVFALLSWAATTALEYARCRWE